MSTMLPEEISGGSRIDGNSIYAGLAASEYRDKLAHPRVGLGGFEEIGSIQGACLQSGEQRHRRRLCRRSGIRAWRMMVL